MKQIKELADHIREELKDAEEYAKSSAHYVTSDTKLASMYKQIARQELDHVDMEHGEIVRLIRSAKDSGVVIPDTMMEIWDWEHNQMIQRIAEVKAMIEMAG